MRVFLDANILFSAAKSNGAVRQLLTLLVQGGHDCCADSYVVEEARRNLLAKAPDALTVLDSLLGRVRFAATHAHSPPLEGTLGVPEKDRPVLAAAIRLRCGALLTGDRTHFGTFYGKTISGVTIYSPSLLARALLTRE